MKTNINISILSIVIKLEEAAMAAVAIFFLTQYSLGLPLWLWFILFFSPDISMLGYLVNTRIGAFCYNLFHHKGIAIALAAVGYFTHQPVFTATGLLLFGHSSFDRMMGYGLKYSDDFKNTHLGVLPGGGKK